MKESDLLANTKKEIRSVLLPEKSGLPLRQFCRRYKRLLGYDLPYKELGFYSVEDFLQNIHGEVIHIVWSHTHRDFHLKGIPDETTKHIEKLVQKQKPSIKTLENACNAWSYVSYEKPPRFTRNLPTKTSIFSKINNNKTVPAKDTENVPSLATNSVSFNEMVQRIIGIVKKHPDGIDYNELTSIYEKKFNAPLDFKSHNFESLAECLEEILELQPKNVDGVVKIFGVTDHLAKTSQELPSENSLHIDAVHNWLENNRTMENHPPLSPELNQKHIDYIPAGLEDDFIDYDDDDTYDRPTVSLTLKAKLREILLRNPRGIFSKDFKSSFMAFYGEDLDLSAIGYGNFLDLVEDSPDIFAKVPSGACGNDWLLFDAESRKKNSPQNPKQEHKAKLKPVINLDDVAINVRRILLGNGRLFIDEFEKLYLINTKTPLNIKDMGFNDLREFFEAIEEKVPLKLDYSNVRTKVCLKYSLSPVPPDEPVIPFDSVLCDKTFTIQDLPCIEDDKYFPMYVGTVINPDLIYVQLKGKETSSALEKIGSQLQIAYSPCSANGPHGEKYLMQPQDIVMNAPCAAIFSVDHRWYRGKIVRVGETSVTVLFVDYGNEETVTKENLRYLKKDHFELPAQAIPSRLAFITLPLGQRQWGNVITTRIMALCEDKCLMAKAIASTLYPDTVSLHIMDTKYGPEQVDLSAQLVKEGLAAYYDEGLNSHFVPINKNIPNHTPASCKTEFFTKQVPDPDEEAVKEALNTVLKFHKSSQERNQQTLNGPSGFQPTLMAPNPLNTVPNILEYMFNRKQFYQDYGFPYFDAPFLPYQPPLPLTEPPNLSPVFSAPLPNQVSNTSSFQNQQVNGVSQYNDTHKLSHYVPNGNNVDKLSVSSASINHPVPVTNSSVKLLTGAPLFSSNNVPQPIKSASVKNSSNSDENNNLNELFPEDDDDESFLKICKIYGAVQRYVQRLHLTDGYIIHIILLDDKPYVASCDILKLFWPEENRPVLQRRLRQCDILLDTVVISRKDYADIFYQLEQFNIKGSQSSQGELISMYLLQDILIILNAFGHSSPSIRSEIRTIMMNFNPKSPFWQSFTMDEEENKKVDAFTDASKFERMCLYDLSTICEGLKYKRLKAFKSLLSNGINKGVIMEQIQSYEKQIEKCKRRIAQIELLCC